MVLRTPKSKGLSALLLAVVLIAALGIRLLAAHWWQGRLEDPRRFAFPDSHTYWVLGQHLARGEPYQFGADTASVFRAPGYPLMLAGLFRITGDDPPVLAARYMGAILGTLSVAGVMLLARQLFDLTTALIAGCCATIYPGAIAMSTFVLSEAPFCPWMLAQLICWVQATRMSPQARWQALAWALAGGLSAGCATLVRPSWLLFTPVCCCLAPIVARWCSTSPPLAASLPEAGSLKIAAVTSRSPASRSTASRQVLIGMAMMIGLCLAMTPWWVRNYRVTGGFVPTTLQVGASLYDGWRPDAAGGSDMRFALSFFKAQRRADAQADREGRQLKGTFEQRLDARLRRAAVAWARENPGRALQLAAIKFGRMWNPWPNAREFGSWQFRLVVAAFYLPLVLLCAGGAIRFARHGWIYCLMAMPAVYFSGLHMVFVSSIRYRQPPLLVCLVLAAGLIRLRFSVTEAG